jgi:hypothetical protein
MSTRSANDPVNASLVRLNVKLFVPQPTRSQQSGTPFESESCSNEPFFRFVAAPAGAAARRQQARTTSVARVRGMRVLS